jgi:hypothetical protein
MWAMCGIAMIFGVVARSVSPERLLSTVRLLYRSDIDSTKECLRLNKCEIARVGYRGIMNQISLS